MSHFLKNTQSCPLVMGILNVTPDSVAGDGVYKDADKAIALASRQVEKFIKYGVNIIDIGGESTRPGSDYIAADIELERVIPVIESVRKNFPDILLSIDTYKAEVADKAINAGANIINDVWGLKGDKDMAKIAIKHDCPIILMHNKSQSGAIEKKGDIAVSYKAADYGDVVADVKDDLIKIADEAIEKGIKADNIILDPGIGFGKNVQENMQLIKGLDEIRAIGYPVLLGPSRKSFIGHVLGRTVDERLAGTAACTAIAMQKNVDIIRVHDAPFMADFVKMFTAIDRVNAK